MNQREIPDGLRGDEAVDLRAGIKAARYQLDRLSASMRQIEGAIETPKWRDPQWAYGTDIEVYMGLDPDTDEDQWIQAFAIETRPGYVLVRCGASDTNRAWVKRSSVRLRDTDNPTRVGSVEVADAASATA